MSSPRTPTVEGILRDLASRVAALERRMGTVPTGSDSDAPYEALGDLLVGLGYGLGTRLAVGEDERVLEADSSATTGVKWGRKITSSTTAPDNPAIGDIWLQLP